ncbi:circularly permuted type 2 ATP-grasp protein [Pseudoclavibacter sp. CFCC 11306]|uniref:circularly permuted type 2 ATP-grasp protein n=1 Tax=Pseudoclavibacter sp. CFCC 11306 TaxID=1564493 RepID=UPI00130111EB|nr:circularly permuted type 2 ATP-grasp protein [Pseudoclavibacter sp. CFCC 11306]KAB1659087.1 circularly permuted type 2 ATP-grasp protein [Pseudoclavibacter sp. CFCC 11306]
MSDLFAGYHTAAARHPFGSDAWDEMFSVLPGTPGTSVQVRDGYDRVLSVLEGMPRRELSARIDALANSYLTQGVTFDFAGEERPFPIDPIPRIIEDAEWRHVEAGIAQRVRALEALLDDVYGPQNAIRDQVIPSHIVASSKHFHRQAAGIRPANGVRIQVAGIDLIRDAAGTLRVLEDNVRVPSGVSYVMSNRSVMAQSLPELFGTQTVRPVTEYPSRLLAALRAAAPADVEDPTVVVLTPGMHNSAYYEHTLLARRMGVELVEGRDLFCTGGRVYMRTTGGPERVDVIYRRTDDEFIDPLNFRADSLLGSPGIMLAARLGHVTIANAVGNGVADDKLMYTYVPDLIRYYLHEEPVIPNVPTWRLEDPVQLEEVLDRLDELVVKPVDGSGGKGIVLGPQASRDELDQLRRRLRKDPRGWIAQPVVMLSTIPSVVEDGIRPRHVDLRPFAVNDGEDVWVLPGGLTRVALPEGQLVVNSSQGGGSKDTWVLGAPARSSLADELVHDDQIDAPANDLLKLGGAVASGGTGSLIGPDQGPRNAPDLRRQQEQEQQQSRDAHKHGEVRHAVANR